MSSTRESGNPSLTADRVEECADCERETDHEVQVEIRTENPDSTFSREPYRVTECQTCGATSTERLNDA